jgi:O-acetyl-ADP-ribose deacetylase (regulator of RNase III)
MTISLKAGDLFDSSLQTIVNTVNCKGVMGTGIALHCKQLYPEMYEDYVARCAQKEVEVGKPYLFRRDEKPWILNFPTKKHWRNPSKVKYISDGLSYLREHYEEWGITSLAIPALGCGNGGLQWQEVGPLMYRILSEFSIPIEIFAPAETPEIQLTETFLVQQQPQNNVLQSAPIQATLIDVDDQIVTLPKKRTKRRK